MGRHTTIQRLKRKVFFPRMRLEVEQLIDTCKTCQKKDQKQQNQRHTLVSPSTGYPFQRIHIDFVGPLNASRRSGATWILTCRDSFSKWPEAFPLQKANAKSVATTLEKEIFMRYGYPEAIHSDQGRQFTSGFLKNLGKELGIQITDTTGYNPKANGQVERMHRDLYQILRALTSDLGDLHAWEDALPEALFALRTAPGRSTGLAPYQILFGRECSTPINKLFGAPPEPLGHDPTSMAEYHRVLRQKIAMAQKNARANLAKAVIRQRRQYHRDRKTLETGSKEWLFTPSSKVGVPKKLTTYWMGLWVICTKPDNSETLLIVAPHPSWIHKTKITGTKVVSIDRIKPYRDNETDPTPLNHEHEIDVDDDEFVEYIPLPPPTPVQPPTTPPLPPILQGQPPSGTPTKRHLTCTTDLPTDTEGATAPTDSWIPYVPLMPLSQDQIRFFANPAGNQRQHPPGSPRDQSTARGRTPFLTPHPLKLRPLPLDDSSTSYPPLPSSRESAPHLSDESPPSPPPLASTTASDSSTCLTYRDDPEADPNYDPQGPQPL